MKFYDFIAGRQGLTSSRFLTKDESKLRFPTLALERKDGSTLKGSVRDHENIAKTEKYRSSTTMGNLTMPD